MIVRAVVGWGGKGVRGDTDRIGQKILAGCSRTSWPTTSRWASRADRAARSGRRPRRARMRPLRLRVGARAGVLLPEVRHATPARLTPARHGTLRSLMPVYEYICTACDHRSDILHGINDPGPALLPVVRSRGHDAEADRRARDPLPRLRLGEEGPQCDLAKREVDVQERRRRRRRRRTAATGRRRQEGRRWRHERRRRRHEGRQLQRAALERRLQRARPARRPAPTEPPRCRPPATGSRSPRRPRSSNRPTCAFTPATIGGWARAGRLQSIKLGGRRFVRRGEVKALVAGPRRVNAQDLQPRLFEDLTG